MHILACLFDLKDQMSKVQNNVAVALQKLLRLNVGDFFDLAGIFVPTKQVSVTALTCLAGTKIPAESNTSPMNKLKAYIDLTDSLEETIFVHLCIKHQQYR